MRIPRLPEFTQQAAEEINRLQDDLDRSRPRENYIPCIGWQLRPSGPAFSRPVLSLRERKHVSMSQLVYGHGMYLAYDLPAHVLMIVRSYVLDFDGGEFIFLSRAAARRQRPKRRHFNADQKLALRVATVRTFMREYGRKAQKRIEPNDRGYSREFEQRVKRMKPGELDRLLRDDED